MTENELVFENKNEFKKYFKQFSVEKCYEIAEKNKIICLCANDYAWVLTKI